MHKNIYNPKTLNGNWFENRFTDEFEKQNNESSNTYLPNPSFNKYVTTSKAIGNSEGYEKVSRSSIIYIFLVTLWYCNSERDQFLAIV